MNTQNLNAIELTQNLVRLNSTNPGAYEGDVARYICNILENEGITTQTSEVLDGRCNVKAMIPGEHTHPALVLICHMDTVVEGIGWNDSPFSGEIKDGRLYGRGACDMKAGLACALSVFIETARSVKRGEITLQYPLVFIGTVDEEGDMQGVEQVLRDGWVMKEDWVLDTEPTFGEIQVAHKGRTWFQIEMQGVTAHASMPQTGADAIAAMSYVVTYLRERFLTYPIHEEMGPSTITFGQIQGGYAPYVVPDLARLTIDMRLTPPVTTQVVTELVEEAIAYATQKVQGVTGSYRITGDRPSIEKDSNSFLLHQLSDAVQSITGQDAKVRVFPGYTDTAVIAGKLQNHNCMSYGPGSLEQAHKPNEYVATTEIDRCQEIFRVLVRKMLTYERAL